MGRKEKKAYVFVGLYQNIESIFCMDISFVIIFVLMNKKDFIEQIGFAVKGCGMSVADGPVLVALSGGADSVALLHVLRMLNFKVEAVHCNFELRGAESDRDEIFVRKLCSKMQVKLHVSHFDTRDYASRKGISIEMAARELRYAYFENLRQERKASCIAVAHHRDDNVETVLLNLIRGTGIHGLTGMASRNGFIVRPLLGVSRADIEAFLAAEGQDFVTDSTNLQDEVVRNKIRLNILPLLKDINPAIVHTLQVTATRLAGTAVYYDRAIDEACKRVCHDDCIDTVMLRREPAPMAVLYEILSPKGFNNQQVEEIYKQINGLPGKVYESREWRLLRDRDCFRLRHKDESGGCLCTVLPLQGVVRVTPQIQFVIRRVVVDASFSVPRHKDCVCMDMDKLTLPLTVRLIRDGDRFIPFGMKGEKLVSDYLTNLKKSLFEKERQLVVCSGGQIAWLVGERPDNRFRVDDHTRSVLCIQAMG